MENPIKQTLVQNVILFDGVTQNTFKCKNQRYLILEIETSGLTSNPTLYSFSYYSIGVSAKMGATVFQLHPITDFVEGTKKTGATGYQFIRNGKWQLVYDLTPYSEVTINKGIASAGASAVVKCSIVEDLDNILVQKYDVARIDETQTINNFPIVDDYISIKVNVTGLASGQNMRLIITGSNLTDNYVVGNNLIATNYPIGTIPVEVNGGVVFEKNGFYTLYFTAKNYKYLRISQASTAPAGKLDIVVRNEKYDTANAYNQELVNSKSINYVKNKVYNFSDFSTIAEKITIPVISKFIRISFSGTGGTSGAISVSNFDGKTNSYPTKIDYYSERDDSFFRDYANYYTGEVKDVIIIPTENYSRIYFNSVDIVMSELKIEYIDNYTADVTVKYRKEANGFWSLLEPTFKTICAFNGLNIKDVNYMRVEYDYKKGLTTSLQIFPRFKEIWTKDLVVENRPRFYNIFGDALSFRNVFMPDTYKFGYASLIHDSQDVYFIKTNGKDLITNFIEVIGVNNDNPSNPFSLSVKISVHSKVTFFESRVIKKRTFDVEQNEFKNYRFENQARYKNAHIYGGGGFIYVSGDGARYYKLPINSNTFPNLPAGNNYPLLYIVGSSFYEANGYGREFRMVVVVNGKVYNNFPTDVVGSLSNENKENAIVTFAESKIWDLPVRQQGSGRTDLTNRRLPSKLTESEIAALPGSLKYIYKYFPVLPNEMYNADGTYKYSETDNSTPFKETWKDGEFLVTFPRFYNFRGSKNASFFNSLMSPPNGSKMTMLVNYFTTTADRGVAIVTADGENWFVKFELASLQNPDTRYHVTPLHGNNIITDNISEVYSSGLKMAKRTYVVPTNATKEPSTMFNFSDFKNVTAITKATGAAGNETAVVTVAGHGLASRDVIVFKTNNYSGEFRCLANDAASPTSGGNGTFFIVEKIDNDNFKIREYIHSPDHNITGRHLHFANDLKDGFVVSTGEEYPDGWLVYLQQTEKDQPQGIAGSEHMPVYRLNSSENGLYRASGFIMLDDDATNPTCFFASDESDIPRGVVQIPGRTNLFGRNSSGVYKGKLADIDDMSKWECILPCDEMVLGLKQYGRYIIAFGMAGGFWVSDDNGKTWDSFKFDTLQAKQMYTNSFIYTETARILLK